MVGAELMLLGFISLLLNVFQGATQKICVRESLMHHLLPCPVQLVNDGAKNGATVLTGVLGGARRLLAGGGATDDYCLRKVFTLFYSWNKHRTLKPTIRPLLLHIN